MSHRPDGRPVPPCEFCTALSVVQLIARTVMPAHRAEAEAIYDEISQQLEALEALPRHEWVDG